MENWLSNVLDLPDECQVEQSIPRSFFTKNFELSSGEANLLQYGIDQMMIVGAIGPNFGNVPAYKDDEQDFESVVVMLVENKGGKVEKQAAKIAAMLQKHLPQYVLLGITDGEHVCLSIASKYKQAEEETLQIKESFISPILTIEKLMELTEDYTFDKLDKTDLNALWNNYCEYVAATNGKSVDSAEV